MPGGVDIHAHIAGPKVNAARKLAPEEHRADTAGADRDHPLRHGRHRPLDVRHRLPLRAARLHDRRRRRHAAARRAPHARRAARHARHRRRLPGADGQQPAALQPHPRRSGTRARGDRVVPAGDRRLRRQARQSRRRRDVQARQLQRHLARRRGPGRHAAERDRGDRDRGPRARAAAPGARPLQQPRRVRQLPHDARHAAHARRPPRPPRPPAVPRLRREAGRAAALAGAGARRVPRRAPGDQRRRRAGDVRPGDDDDRRRAGLRGPARGHPRPLGQRRHRGRDRLRDRAVHLPRAQLRARAAVGDRPRAVPAQPRPVAARAVHRSPQRRLVPQLSAPDPPADGPRLPQRADPAGEPPGDEAHRPARRPRSRVHAGGDRDHHARRAGAAARAARQGPPRRGRRRRHHDLRRPRRSRGDVRRAPLRHQGRRARSSRTASCARPDPGRLLRVGAEYDPSIDATLEALFEDHYSVQFASYPVREPWLLEPARTVAAEPR